jgi:hypothetical protein
MNAYMVVLHPDPVLVGGRHQKLLDTIQSYKFLRLSETPIFLIATPDSVKEVWHKLFGDNEPDFSGEDRLYVIPVCKPFEGYCQKHLRPWFEENIPDEYLPN